MLVPIHIARNYLQLVREKTGLDFSTIARRAGFSNSTITRPADPGYKKRMRLETLLKIRQVHKVDFPTELLTLARRADTRLPSLADPSKLEKVFAISDLIGQKYKLSSAEKAELAQEILIILEGAAGRSG